MSNDTRLVLLDIDGVIRTWPATCPTFVNTAGRKVLWHNTIAVAALNWLLRESQAQLVISSSWRAQGVRGMQRDLDDWGVHALIYSMIAPDDSENPDDHRGAQIEQWMQRWCVRHPGVEPYVVVLDDDEVCCGFTLIRTTTTEGLTWEKAELALAYLLGTALPERFDRLYQDWRGREANE